MNHQIPAGHLNTLSEAGIDCHALARSALEDAGCVINDAKLEEAETLIGGALFLFIVQQLQLPFRGPASLEIGVFIEDETIEVILRLIFLSPKQALVRFVGTERVPTRMSRALKQQRRASASVQH